MIEQRLIPDHPLENPAILGLVHTSGATLGAGLGVLLASQLGSGSRKAVGITLITSGVVLMAPLVVASIVKGLRQSNSAGTMRRRLNSIREGATYLQDMENPDVPIL